jgi:hypothetical protein
MAQTKRLPHATVIDGGQVAGIHTQLIDVTDRNNVITQQLWVDPKTGAILKRVGYNRFGQPIASSEFRSVQFAPSLSASTFQIDTPGTRIVTAHDELTENARKAGVPALTLASASGFELVGSQVRRPNNQTVLASTYQGPHGRITVFILKARIDPSLLQNRVPLGQSTYSTTRAGASIVLVGPYSAGELQSAANSLSGG